MKKIIYILSFLFCVVSLIGCNNDNVTIERTVVRGNPIEGVQEIETVYNLNDELVKKYDGYFNDTYYQIANLLDSRAPEVGEYSWNDSIPPYNFYKTLECTFSKYKNDDFSIKFTFRDPVSGLYEAIQYKSRKAGLDIQELTYSKKSDMAVNELGSGVVLERFELMRKYCADQLVSRQHSK